MKNFMASISYEIAQQYRYIDMDSCNDLLLTKKDLDGASVQGQIQTDLRDLQKSVRFSRKNGKVICLLPVALYELNAPANFADSGPRPRALFEA